MFFPEHMVFGFSVICFVGFASYNLCRNQELTDTRQPGICSRSTPTLTILSLPLKQAAPSLTDFIPLSHCSRGPLYSSTNPCCSGLTVTVFDTADCIHKSYTCNRPWRPIGLWDVKAPTISRQSAHRWQWGCQSYAPVALCPQKIHCTHFY
jgi:hypothetical protein